MADVFTRTKRSAVMARVRSRETSPELLVYRALKALGYRLSRHRGDLPGKPDFVVDNIAVFVNGCFWHQHPGCEAAKRPQSNRAYWDKKLSSNVRRDRRAARSLRKLGFNVVNIWECRLRRPTAASYVSRRIRPATQTASKRAALRRTHDKR
jgi:DNA mismatch endonuclease, patch repair protein